MVVHAAGILRVRIWIKRSPSIVILEQLLDFPVIRLDAYREFKIFLGDVVPELEAGLVIKLLLFCVHNEGIWHTL